MSRYFSIKSPWLRSKLKAAVLFQRQVQVYTYSKPEAMEICLDDNELIYYVFHYGPHTNQYGDDYLLKGSIKGPMAGVGRSDDSIELKVFEEFIFQDDKFCKKFLKQTGGPIYSGDGCYHYEILTLHAKDYVDLDGKTDNSGPNNWILISAGCPPLESINHLVWKEVVK